MSVPNMPLYSAFTQPAAAAPGAGGAPGKGNKLTPLQSYNMYNWLLSSYIQNSKQHLAVLACGTRGPGKPQFRIKINVADC